MISSAKTICVSGEEHLKKKKQWLSQIIVSCLWIFHCFMSFKVMLLIVIKLDLSLLLWDEILEFRELSDKNRPLGGDRGTQGLITERWLYPKIVFQWKCADSSDIYCIVCIQKAAVNTVRSKPKRDVFAWMCFRLWNGGHSPAGGGILSHKRNCHFLLGPGCRIQRVCNFR